MYQQSQARKGKVGMSESGELSSDRLTTLQLANLLKKLPVVQLLKNIPAFYGN
jgi:hypothetical protein